MIDDFISVSVDLAVNLLKQILANQTVNEHLKIISSIGCTELGSVRFENSENFNIPKVASLKRFPPALKKAAPAVKAKQTSKLPKPILTSALNTSNNDYAILSAASSKVDTSTLISVVQNLRTNEKEYRCSFCEYKSKSQRNAKRHVELKHVDTGVLFRCKMCPKTNKLKADLKSHYMKAHQMPDQAAKAMLED